MAAVARAKGALDALKSSSGNVKVGFDVSTASLVRATAAADAMTAATTRSTRATGTWADRLALAHNILTVFGANIIADTIGIIAFGVGATTALTPVFQAFKNLGQTYGYLTPLQKNATVQLTNFVDQFQRADQTGVFATFTALLDMVNAHVGRSGGIMQQAGIAFQNWMAMLRQAFSSGPWQALFSRGSAIIQTDMTALFGLLTAIINLIPALFHDFNGLGLWVISSATAILHLIAVIGNADPALVRFAAVVFLVYRALNMLGQFKAGSFLVRGIESAIGPLSSFRAEGSLVADTLKSIQTYGLGTTAFLLTGLTPAMLGTAAGALAVGAGVAALIGWLNGVKNTSNSIVNSLTAQDNAVGDNVAGYQKLAAQLQANINQGQQYVGASRQATGALLLQKSAQQQAAQTAQTLSGNLNYLERTYHLTQQQAIQLAQATGVNLHNAFNVGGGAAQATRLKIQAYEQTVNAAKNPTSALSYDLGRAANTALQLDDRVTALTNAFNALLTPFANVITDTVNWKNGNQALEAAVDKSNGKVGYANGLQRASAGALATAINYTSGLSQAILQQTGSMVKAAGPIQKEIAYLQSLHSTSSIVTQAIKILQQYIDNLHSKTLTITTNFVNNGAPATGYFPGPHGHIVNYASGTSSATPGWHWVGERGPELAYFRGGEVVVPHQQSVAMAASGYADGTGGVIELQPIVIMLDGKPIYKAVEQRVYGKNLQNGMRTRQGNVQGRFGVR